MSNKNWQFDDRGQSREARPRRTARIAPRAKSTFGLSLIEVVAATLIVGMMSVAALNSLGSAMRSAESTGNRAIAQALADQLMSEILLQHYKEPTQTAQFGPEASESDGTRSQFDDVDDYHLLSEQPPADRDGTEHANRDDWSRSVTVEFVSSLDISEAAATDQGAKRIRVTVEHDGKLLADQSAVKTQHK